jgi:hypothetical protein
MNKYFLNEDVLMATCYFHNTLEGPVRPNYTPEIKDKITKSLNSQLFRDLLIKQPDLTEIYNEYISEIHKGNVYPSTLFAKMFADKIEIKNFTEQLLKKHYSFKDKDKRKNLFKYLLENHPPFINLVHHFIKENHEAGNTFLSEDTLLYNFYFNTLKNKNTDKSSLDPQEVLSNIDSFKSVFETALNKKKLNAYLLYFPKDMNLYNHIMEQMHDLINNDATFKSLWEEKITLFPQEVRKEYSNKNISINPWSDQESYHYKFQVNEEYIIEQSNVSATKAERFGRVFHNSLGSIIHNKFNTIEETRISNPSVSFLFSSEEDRTRARKFCNSVAENILFLIKNSNFELQYQEQYDFMDMHLQKILTAFILSEELNQQNNGKINKITNKL